jgi:hypothetical protein
LLELRKTRRRFPYEKKLKTMEKETTDEMEVAKKKIEKRKA